MKFWAKIRLNGEENASELVSAFFKEFNPESSINIQGKEAKVEIIFSKDPPMETIKAVKQCYVEEFYCGKVLEQYCECENQHVAVEESDVCNNGKQVVCEEEYSEHTEQVIEEDKTPKQEVQAKKKRGRASVRKAEAIKVSGKEAVNIPKLEEAVKKATSFKHFVKLVSELLEMGKKQQIFENLAIVASEVEKISWKEVEKALKDKGIILSQYDRVYIGRKVSERLKEDAVTLLSLLNAIRHYKDYSFEKEMSEEKVITAEAGSFTHVEESTLKNRVKMDCMPEIPHFEETLGSVDKTQTIEHRVRHVLNGMGWKKQSFQEQQEIFEIANIAVRKRQMHFDSIFSEATISLESPLKARLTFSKFINDFVSEYDPNKQVKLLDFLRELQKIVMKESELES